MDEKTLLALQRACHIRLTPEESEAFLRELREIEAEFPDLAEDLPVSGAAEVPYLSLRDDEPVPGPYADPSGRTDPEGYYTVRGDGHE